MPRHRTTPFKGWSLEKVLRSENKARNNKTNAYLTNALPNMYLLIFIKTFDLK